MDDFSSIDDKEFSKAMQTPTQGFLQKAATIENLRQVLNNSHNAVVCLDRKGVIIYWNENSCTLFGFIENEAIGKNWSQILFHERESLTQEKIELVIKDARSMRNVELRIRSKTGEWVEVLVNLLPIKDDTGKVSACCLMVIDISEKVAEAINELYDSLLRKNKELYALHNEIRTFNIVAAHDYKETLQQLYTNLEYIINNDARNLSNTGKSNLRRAQSAIQRMHLLTDDINNYLRLYELDVKLGPVDSLEVLKTVLSNHQPKLEQYNAKVEYMSLPVLLSDGALLFQLFANLIDNAIKFRNIIVPLIIHLKYSQAVEMHLIPGSLKDIPYGIISVSDNGLGFSEEEAEKIFEILYRRAEGKERGTGIGLASCRRIMALHDGFITANSQPAKGATFNCYFPLERMED